MNDTNEIEDLRKKYSLIELNEKTISKHPFEQFDKWYRDVLDSRILEPTAMIVSTANRTGIPSVLTEGIPVLFAVETIMAVGSKILESNTSLYHLSNCSKGCLLIVFLFNSIREYFFRKSSISLVSFILKHFIRFSFYKY